MQSDSSKRYKDKGRNHGPSRGRDLRERAVATAMKRKEEYLGARVPKELRDRVIQKADALGMPVSILIRNILEEAIRSWGKATSPAAGAVSDDGSRHADMAPAPIRFPNVLGWEEIRLNKSVNCGICGICLEPGASVTLGLAGPGEEHVVLCQRCKQVT
jgi:hypothetical protein